MDLGNYNADGNYNPDETISLQNRLLRHSNVSDLDPSCEFTLNNFRELYSADPLALVHTYTSMAFEKRHGM